MSAQLRASEVDFLMMDSEGMSDPVCEYITMCECGQVSVLNACINEMPHSPPPGSRWGLVRLLTISLGRRGGALVYFFRL